MDNFYQMEQKWLYDIPEIDDSEEEIEESEELDDEN